METRKLQQVGGGTYTVSIPKPWAVEHGLEAGSEVHLYSHADGSIVVRSSENDGGALEAVRIEIESKRPAHVGQAIRAAHTVGFERICLRSDSGFTDAQRRAARSTKRQLVGIEIVAEDGHEIAVQNLLDAADVSIRQSVVQLQFVALSVHRRATTVLVEEAPLDRDRLDERVEEADRLSQMTARHFSRSLISMAEVDRLGVLRPSLFDHYLTSEALARAAMAGGSIARAVDELGTTLPADLRDELRSAMIDVRELVDVATSSVLEGADVEEIYEVFDAHDDSLAAIEAIDRVAFDEPDAGFSPPPKAAQALTRALDGLTRTVDNGGRIGEVALRSALRKPT